MEKQFYRVNELVRITGLSKSQIYVMVESGELAATKVGRTILIPSEEVRRWIDALRQAV